MIAKDACGWECKTIYKGKIYNLDNNVPNSDLMINIPLGSKAGDDNCPKCPDCGGKLAWMYEIITCVDCKSEFSNAYQEMEDPLD